MKIKVFGIANISVIKAQIFIRIFLVVNYYLVSLSFKFHEDLRINTCARVVNACAHILSRVCAFMTCPRAFVHGSS